MAEITREDVAALIQEEYSNVLLGTVDEQSAAIKAFGTVPLGTKVTNAPVLASLPEAKWVSEAADATGKKPTSKATWSNKQFIVEEIAVIVPIHEDVLEDATEDLITDITKLGGTAIGKKLDQAVFFGQDKPATWTSDDLFAAATSAGSLFQVAASAGKDDLAGSIYQAASAVDDSGADPTAIISAGSLRFKLANLRASDGTAIYQALSNNGVVADNIAGLDASFARNGSWDNTKALALIADADRVKIGVRQDITVKFLDQATVNGVSLAETDRVAFRFKARYAYVLGNSMAASGTVSKPVAAVIPAQG
ncbi:MAG: phage major capsid protein [Bifidobacterium mongoliense]|jgi:HK97 family phage major capsid protein|uniref:phage major capsid protein n=1 Tax=Bifidobacterium mongoliense TaxID=518643 RepID=UPI002F35D6E8